MAPTAALGDARVTSMWHRPSLLLCSVQGVPAPFLGGGRARPPLASPWPCRRRGHFQCAATVLAWTPHSVYSRQRDGW
eukprot:scaffold19286_cov146-Isochrysis_galbana.AAC.3